MSAQEHNFEAPELKAAIRRALPADPASPALRSRIQQLLSEYQGDAPIPMPQPATRAAYAHWPIKRLAIAACIGGLALGAGIFYLTNTAPFGTFGTGTNVVQAPVQTPAYLNNALLHHDQLANDLRAGIPLERRLQPLNQVSQQFSGGVQSHDGQLATTGWRFVGATTFEDRPSQIAQLFYVRGDQTLSAFIVPTDHSSAIDSVKVQGNIVAVRAINGGTLCVVGRCPSGKLDPKEVEQLADVLASH